MYSVINHVLHKDGKPVAQKPSPNRGGKISATLLVYHFTGGDSASGAIATLTSAAAKVSAHLVLDKDGAVTQLVPLNVAAWHAGVSRWGLRSGCNNFAIGVEMVNAGPLLKAGDGTYKTQIGQHIVPPAHVIHAKHRVTGGDGYWADYPEAQIQAAIEIGQAIRAAYKITDIAGHEDIAPRRKVDPGPAFPLESVRSRVMGRA
jgi:N-acetylmuramoyl-L-alanine amidase